MEECEALCTRMAIMVNGQFKCIGSTQRLKTKFGEGYTVIAKVRAPAGADQATVLEAKTARLVQFMESTFPGSEKKDQHEGLVHYHVLTAGLTWAGIFGTMERAKVEYDIEDYQVGQTTLEQVFINFARRQRPPQEFSSSCLAKCKASCC